MHHAPRLVTNKSKVCDAAIEELETKFDHRQHKGLLPLFTRMPRVRLLGSSDTGFCINRAPSAPSSPLAADPA